MKGEILLYTGATLPFFWGFAHLFPTKSIVQGFGNISADNKHIITMEWIIEGIALIFIGSLVLLVTLLDPHQNTIATAVYLSTSICLITFAILSLFTGFKVNFFPFKLCPIIFTSSAILITLGWKIL